MKTLSNTAQQKARDFLVAQARPLERALYQYEFEQGSKNAMLEELGKFQNPDGGFGHALEPDFRAPQSSALATSVALDILRELGVPAEASVVGKAIRYLLESYDREKSVWRIIPEGTDASPHAPWWNKERLESTFDGFRSNPKVELAGYLWLYESLVPSGFKNAVLESVLRDFGELPENLSGDAVLCYVRLASITNLPLGAREKLQQGLQKTISASVETNPQQWGGYCLKPLWVASSPDSPFYETIADAVERNLDYEIDEQCPDGSWTPNWNWAGVFPEAWQQAEREWRGILTLRNLQRLRRFERCE